MSILFLSHNQASPLFQFDRINYELTVIRILPKTASAENDQQLIACNLLIIKDHFSGSIIPIAGVPSFFLNHEANSKLIPEGTP
jgi:hypothetical protein